MERLLAASTVGQTFAETTCSLLNLRDVAVHGKKCPFFWDSIAVRPSQSLSDSRCRCTYKFLDGHPAELGSLPFPALDVLLLLAAYWRFEGLLRQVSA